MEKKYIGLHTKFDTVLSPSTKDELLKYGVNKEYKYYLWEPKKLTEVDIDLVIANL